MARKLKLTGFAKFFFLLLILTPIAYIIASYANGEDGIQNIKRLIGLEEHARQQEVGQEPTTTLPAQKPDNLEAEIQALKDSLAVKDSRIRDLQEEIRRLQVNRR